MKKNFVKKMEKKLIEERRAIIDAANVKANDLDVDFDGDETDEVQANLLVYLTEQINSRNGNTVKRINEALKKIKEDVYGICEDCEEEISEKRLEFNPHFTTCIKCAEAREKEAKQLR